MEILILLLVGVVGYLLIMPLVLLSKINGISTKIREELHKLKQPTDDIHPRSEAQPIPTVQPQENCEPEPIFEVQFAEGSILPEPVVMSSIAMDVDHEPQTTYATVNETEKMDEPDEMEELYVQMHECSEEVIPMNIEPLKPPHVAAPKPRKKINYEKFIGENFFGKIGVLIFVVGIGLFVKYAIDQNWINETLRTVIGFGVGSALLATAGFLQTKYRTFSSLLAGGAFAVFYLTVAIAFHYYNLFSQTTAFIILIGITVIMPVLAILYNRRELAIISLVGGFLAPFIVSSGDGNYLVLFTYITILNFGMFYLSIRQKWIELPIISFVFTSLITYIYIVYLGPMGIEPFQASILLLFCTLFYFIFLLPIISILRSAGKVGSRVLLSTVISNNFVFMGLGFLLLNYMKFTFAAGGLLSLFVAIVNLALVIWLRKHKQGHRFLIYALLGLVLTFVSLTIPLQLKGNYITVFWASEMVLLLWLYIKSRTWVYEYATFALIILTFISLIMDLLDPGAFDAKVSEPIFANGRFATFLFIGLAMGTFALLMGRFRKVLSEAKLLKYSPWNGFMIISSVIILYITFFREFYLHMDYWEFPNVLMIFNSSYIMVICYAFRKRFSLERYGAVYKVLMGGNAVIYMLFVWIYDHDHSLLWIIWLNAAVVIANMYDLSRRYYQTRGARLGYTVYVSVLSTLLWLTLARLFQLQIGLSNDFSATLSISMCIAGFVQMGLGMRLHQKVLRIFSLCTLGIVLLKLILIDLWALPTVGKITVFILLGLVMLVLSFLYQKLKNVLFQEDRNEEN